MKPIFLCGFMGCGKSTIGKLLAKKTGRSFVDLDIYIEELEQMTIPEIFEAKGESFFRACESKAIADFSGTGGVIATGGGAMLSKENGDTAKKSGVVVFIDTPFETCYQRIKGDKNRPIAFNSTREQLLERFEYRRPLYIQNSGCTVNGGGTPMEIAAEILSSIK